MSRCDFYVLPSADPQQRLLFLYKLLEKIAAPERRIYIRAESGPQANLLDERLWDYRPAGFIPHSLRAEGLDSPVEIGYGDSLPEHRDLYINFAEEIDDQALAFDRIIEIVVQTPPILEATRHNYRRYQQAGYQIHMNDMRPKG